MVARDLIHGCRRSAAHLQASKTTGRCGAATCAVARQPAETLGDQPSYSRTGREAEPADSTAGERARRHTSPTRSALGPAYSTLGPAPASDPPCSACALLAAVESPCGAAVVCVDPPLVSLRRPRVADARLYFGELGALLQAFASVTLPYGTCKQAGPHTQQTDLLEEPVRGELGAGATLAQS